MSTVGPELPPHLLAKRKRQQEDEGQATTNPPPSPPSQSPSPAPSSSSKRRRILGPSLPPAPLTEFPPSAVNTPTNTPPSSSDDEFGPSLPTHDPNSLENQRQQDPFDSAADAAAAKLSSKPQREEWMLVPPTSGDWTSRVDPTKLRNRKFNTGKGSKAPMPKTGGPGGAPGSGELSAVWTETPEQKRQRLEDEVMGVKRPAQLGGEVVEAELLKREKESVETGRRIREYNEQNRSMSLYSAHKKTVPKEKEDNPSKRAFDKEKDIGGGLKIGHAQKKELLTRAADFGSRFAGGNYL